jgi:hypothetical protein
VATGVQTLELSVAVIAFEEERDVMNESKYSVLKSDCWPMSWVPGKAFGGFSREAGGENGRTVCIAEQILGITFLVPLRDPSGILCWVLRAHFIRSHC